MNTESYDKDLFPFEARKIIIDGMPVFYVDEGKGPVILFCHPPIANSFMYRNFIKNLSSSYRCIALDFPGFGFSKATPEYTFTIRSQAEVVKAFIEKLALDNIYLVMQEIGGHAALTALMATPEKLSGIILTDTIIFPVSEYPRISKMLDIVNGKLVNFFNTRFNLLIWASYRFGIRKRKLDERVRRSYLHAFDTPLKRRLATRLLYQLKAEKALMQDIQNAFETTFNNTPVLMIYGREDFLTKLKIPERIQGILGKSELHFIEGEMHFPHEGAPDEMITIIEKWMAGQRVKEKRHGDVRELHNLMS